MKKNTTLVVVALCASLSSCFKDEPLNAECDIRQAYIHADNPEAVFYKPADSLVNVITADSKIRFSVRRDADLTRIAPIFTITEGATITPASGSEHDFGQGPVSYRVTSQDGQWHRDYTVYVDAVMKNISDVPVLGFEHPEIFETMDGKYYVWREDADGVSLDIWATGNPGFALTNGQTLPGDYPTAPVDGGVEGKAVKLETKSTGALGALVNKRIAAGNLFTGKFDVKDALADAMKATMFGVPTGLKPIKFEGWYKYKPGPTYQDKDGNPVPGKTDMGDIYAVLYKNTDQQGNAIVLHGDDVRTNPNIVAVAALGETKATDEWTKFELDFDYTGALDPETLAAYGYSIAVVCTSSNGGATFQGAVGSTLMVDELKITWDKNDSDK